VIDLLANEAFATEAAREDTGQGVEQAESVHGIFLKGAADSFGAEVDKAFAKESGGDFGSGLIAFGAVAMGEEGAKELVAGTADFDALLFAEIVLVTAGFP